MDTKLDTLLRQYNIRYTTSDIENAFKAYYTSAYSSLYDIVLTLNRHGIHTTINTKGGIFDLSLYTPYEKYTIKYTPTWIDDLLICDDCIQPIERCTCIGV